MFRFFETDLLAVFGDRFSGMIPEDAVQVFYGTKLISEYAAIRNTGIRACGGTISGG